VLRPGRRPIVLSRSPSGRVIQGARYPRRPYAGRFEDLEAIGSLERAGVSFNSRYRFRTDRIDIAWKVRRGRTQVELASVHYFFIDGSETGYVVLPGAQPRGAIARLLHPRPQNSNPRPGPSVQVLLAPSSHWTALSFEVTIAPARTAAEAAAVVEALDSRAEA
jgi:hypothetical protein